MARDTRQAGGGAMKDYDPSLYSNPDAVAWTLAFERACKRLGKDCDRDWMLGWFANAMMAMHDHVLRDSVRAAAPEMLEALLGVADSDAQDDEHPCWCANARIGNRHAAHCHAARAAIAKAEGRQP